MAQAKDKILGVVKNCSGPITSREIQKKLPSINRATIYRALHHLKESKLVRVIEMGDGVTRFESSEDHHHHLVCIKCKNSQRVDLPAKDETRLTMLQNKLINKNKFTIFEHSLEFFGLCINCAKQ